MFASDQPFDVALGRRQGDARTSVAAATPALRAQALSDVSSRAAGGREAGPSSPADGWGIRRMFQSALHSYSFPDLPLSPGQVQALLAADSRQGRGSAQQQQQQGGLMGGPSSSGRNRKEDGAEGGSLHVADVGYLLSSPLLADRLGRFCDALAGCFDLLWSGHMPAFYVCAPEGEQASKAHSPP